MKSCTLNLWSAYHPEGFDLVKTEWNLHKEESGFRWRLIPANHSARNSGGFITTLNRVLAKNKWHTKESFFKDHKYLEKIDASYQASLRIFFITGDNSRWKNVYWEPKRQVCKAYLMEDWHKTIAGSQLASYKSQSLQALAQLLVSSPSKYITVMIHTSLYLS